MNLIGFHDLAVIRPNIGLGNTICGYTKHAICVGDAVLIWSKTYVSFSPVFDSPFKYLPL